MLGLVVEVLLQKELNLRSGHKLCTMNCWVYGFHIKWFQQLFFLKQFCKNIPDSPRIKNWMLASCPILFLSCCPMTSAVFAHLFFFRYLEDPNHQSQPVSARGVPGRLCPQSGEVLPVEVRCAEENT